jgi:hypothetical protein
VFVGLRLPEGRGRFLNPLLSSGSLFLFVSPPSQNPILNSIEEGGKGDPAGASATMAYVERGTSGLPIFLDFI